MMTFWRFSVSSSCYCYYYIIKIPSIVPQKSIFFSSSASASSKRKEREREDDDDEKDFGRPENTEENQHKRASNEQSSGDFAAKPTER